MPDRRQLRARTAGGSSIEPKAKLLVLDRIFGEVQVPEVMIGKNIVHLPTVKMPRLHDDDGGDEERLRRAPAATNRHWTHTEIHATLVDLLAIQKEIHSGMFAVMDGTICGNGPGPRTMIPVVKDYMLASDDMVAIDAVARQDDGLRSRWRTSSTSASPTSAGSGWATCARSRWWERTSPR